VFELIEVSKSFDELNAVRSINLKIQSDQITGLIGPNGSGKTTLINMMCGLLKVNSGKILLNGNDISGKTSNEIYRLGVARTFQNVRIFKHMTVLENVISAVIASEPNSFFKIFKNVKKHGNTKIKVAEKMLDIMELGKLSTLFAHELPLAMLRRLEIARALACNPKIIILDEPTGGMNPKETEKISNLILQFVAPGRTCIIIEHKMDLILNVCKNIFVLNHGEIIAQGNPSLVLNQKDVIDAYIGKA